MSNKVESFVRAAAAAAPVRPVVRSKDGQTAATAAGGAPSRDSVRLTGEAQVLARVEQTARESTGVDEAKVDAVRRELAEGRYSPDPKAIAGRLVQTEWSLSGRK